ncbi:MAG: 50S ribosomal protein L22 [Patescibacteria group bacterium]|uniref:Large ribosomal subunit protein uL22 n=1 Tax=candidate division WWE3 bacterium TaxID=2053526 RepID=A0A955EBJ3_UNCKA|nr:50S ribosomal protein L22 [candidate division WWE3 bacterium]
MNTALVYAKSKYEHIGPKKVAVIMDLVRGLPVKEAERVLSFHPTKAAKLILKTLKSASANASHNLELNPNSMYISHIQVNPGPMRKSGRIVARARFSPILKRTSHIIVGLAERQK